MHVESSIDWAAEVTSLRRRLIPPGDVEAGAYFDANRDAVNRALRGMDPHQPAVDSNAGAHVVVNVAAEHIQRFCDATLAKDPRPYKNGYDLEWYHVGDQQKRTLVDASLPIDGGEFWNVYFGAVELTGTGIHFFGEYSLVLASALVPDITALLDRNSFDLENLPWKTEIDAADDPAAQRSELAQRHSGRWGANLCEIVVLKVMDRVGVRRRRLTTGEISQATLVDEDYIEVLWTRRDGGPRRSFGADELLEVRVSAADVALEARIATSFTNGPAAPIEQILWRDKRRAAEGALARAGVKVRVVTSAGRVRSS